MTTLKHILKNSDDYAKILIVTWLKIRDIYIDPYDSSQSSIPSKISLNTRLKKALKFVRTIKKQCIKLNRCNKLIKILSFLEVELSNGKRFVEKITQITTIAQMFELPQQITDLIEILGLNNAEDNEFAKEINNMFDDLDDMDLQKNLTKIEETLNEGTLANFIKNKDKIIDDKIISSIRDNENILEKRDVKINFKKNEQKNNEKSEKSEKPNKITIKNNTLPTTKPVNVQNRYNKPSIILPRQRIGATPNPRSAFRKH